MRTATAAATSIKRPNDVVSDEVRVLLARHRMKSKDLAPILGVSQQAVSTRMTGLKPWTLDDLCVLATYFGVDANALLPGLGKQGSGMVTDGQMLPHLDSNQEPAG